MHITALLAQSDIVLPANTPWWGVIVFLCVAVIIKLIDRRVEERAAQIRLEAEERAARVKSEVEERAARVKSEIADREKDSNRQDNMLTMLQSTTALASELIIKLNTASDAMIKERDALLRVVTVNSGATHHAARQIEGNTQVLLSVSEIIQALKSQMERATDTTDKARETLDYLTKAIESLLREYMVQVNTSPGYNETVMHLTKAVEALHNADLSTVKPEQGDSNG